VAVDLWVPKTHPGPWPAALAERRSWRDGSPEPRDQPESSGRWGVGPPLASARRVGPGSNRFAVSAALAIRSFVGAQGNLGQTRGIATDPIRSCETPAQHAGTSFRHPQGWAALLIERSLRTVPEVVGDERLVRLFFGVNPVVLVVPAHAGVVTERDVVHVEQYLVALLTVPDFVAEVPGILEDDAHRGVSPAGTVL
jgi:hypothetical protein